MKPKPYPRTLPPMPKGQVYLGKGGSFDIPKGCSFQGYTFSPGDDSNWEKGIWLGKTGCFHFCAPANSEVARLNGLAPAKKSPRKAAKKAKSIMSGFSEDVKTAPTLVLEVGKTYLTRDGREAFVACAINADTYTYCIVVKKPGCKDYVTTCMPNGRMNQYSEKDDDIVSEKSDFDWSCLPPWINYVAMDEIGIWYGFEKKPVIMTRTWEVMEAYRIACGIPPQYAPTNQPYDWRESLRVRPGYNPNNSTK